METPNVVDLFDKVPEVEETVSISEVRAGMTILCKYGTEIVVESVRSEILRHPENPTITKTVFYVKEANRPFEAGFESSDTVVVVQNSPDCIDDLYADIWEIGDASETTLKGLNLYASELADPDAKYRAFCKLTENVKAAKNAIFEETGDLKQTQRLTAWAIKFARKARELSESTEPVHCAYWCGMGNCPEETNCVYLLGV